MKKLKPVSAKSSYLVELDARKPLVTSIHKQVNR